MAKNNQNSDKIQDNHSLGTLRKEVNSFSSLYRIWRFLWLVSDKKLQEFEEMKKEIARLTKWPDEFNYYLSDRGWIAHESMNNDLMHKSIELVKIGNIEMAEQWLIEYYSSEKMKWLINKFNTSIRYELLSFAYNDTINKRYYSAVPILLMMIDWMVSDINDNRWFFSKDTNLTAWDSIAWHSSGLSKLSRIFSYDRKKTSNDNITLPYRHWILHGRDLGYWNIEVTAKCWLALFAISDWIKVIEEWRREQPLKERESIFKSLQKSYKSLKETEITKKKIKCWSPREENLFKKEWFEYLDNTPEKEVLNFIKYWKENNYWGLARQISYNYKTQKSNKKMAWRMRDIFTEKNFISSKILSIKDCAPAISTVTLSVVFNYKDKEYRKNITLRCIYESPIWETLIFGADEGKWKFIPIYFMDIEHP